MILTAGSFFQTNPESIDVLIVGAGAAGISLAWRLEGTGLKVCVLESGGQDAKPFAPDAKASALNAGLSNLEDYPFEASRARGLGGTTALWTGACVPLNRDDFLPRDWIAASGWPIRYEDMLPYYAAAAPLFDLVDASSYQHLVDTSPFQGSGLFASFAQIAQNRNFGKRHQHWLSRSNTTNVVMGATVTGFECTASGKAVNGVRVVDPQGVEHVLSSVYTVLACGGIEVPRQLLSAKAQIGAALDCAMENVGRFHMEHPIRSLGTIKLPDARKRVLAFTNMQRTKGAALQGIFSLDPEVRERERLLNIQFHMYRYNPMEADPAIVALKARFDASAAVGDTRNGFSSPRDIWKCAKYAAWHSWNKAARSAWFDHVRLLGFLEQEPDAENRITLSDETDRYGQRLPHLYSKESEMMTYSVSRSLAIIQKSLESRGYPECTLGAHRVAHLEHYGGYGLHHMGGTRMSHEPATGVVDKNCKVHGIADLFVASSSVFPTGGAANPTLTICALALRLADHIAKLLQNRK